MQAVTPNCEATVSPELIALMRGLATAKADADAAAETVNAEEPDIADEAEVVQADPVLEGTSPASVTQPLADTGPLHAVSLRIDGARPMQFVGSELCAADLKQSVQDANGFAGEIATHLRLFRADDGRVLAHVATEPGPGLPARPIHRVADVWASSDLAAFVKAASEDACFAATPPGHHRPGLSLSAPQALQGGIRLPLGLPSTQEIAP